MIDPLTIIHGDALSSLRTMESESAQTCVTSPPYWNLRDYGHEFQIGLEKTPEEYVARLVEVFAEVKRVLRRTGTLWLNLGDSYAGSGCGWNTQEGKQQTNRNWRNVEETKAFSRSKRIPRGSGRWGGGNAPAVNCKPKDLVGIPWMVAFALRADGWYLRSDIIWSKPNPMPESVTDRPTKSHEYIFLLSKSQKYHFDNDAVRVPYSLDSISRYDSPMMGTAPTARQPNGDIGRRERDKNLRDPNPLGRNIRTVWTVTTRPFADAHFATFPPELITPCILAGAPIGGVVLDPFAGSGTTGKVAIELGRKAILIEPKVEYVEMIKRRCQTTIGLPLAI